MILNRNNNYNSNSSNFWIVFLIILILSIVGFGARNPIKEKLNQLITPKQSEIEKIVENYIMNNPKTIIKAVENLQKQEYEESLKQAQLKIQQNKEKLQGKEGEIVLFAGNKSGDVVITTFFDYNCGYCKKNNKDLKELIKTDPNVKIVFKELPILGPQSQQLAKMAIAVYLTDNSKYLDFHNMLMETSDMSQASIENILKSLNIDAKQVNEMTKDPRVQKELSTVADLASQIGVRGIPAFIIADDLIPGAQTLENMQQKIKEIRKSNTNK